MENQNFKIPYFCQNLTESSQKLIRSSTHQPQPVYQIWRLKLKYFSRYLAHKIFKFCFQREITQKRGITQTRKKIRVNYFFMRNLYMKFQNPSIHRSKVSNFTEKWKNQSKFQNSVFLSKFDGKFSKVDQVIYSSAPTSIPNMKALA